MKYLFTFLAITVLSISSSFAQADAIANFFEKYMDDERFTMVYVTPRMFQMLDRLSPDDIDDPDADVVLQVAKDLRGLRILTTDQNPQGFYKEFNAKFSKSNYEPLMLVRDKGSDIQFLIDESNDYIRELVMLVGGQDEFVVLSFTGNIDINKVSKLAKELSLPGGEHLEKLEDKN